MGKSAFMRITPILRTSAYQRRPIQNFSKLYRKLILIWAFRKSTFEIDTKKPCFFWVCLSDSRTWMSLKKILTNFILGTLFFFTLQLLFYMKMQKAKNYGVLAKKKYLFYRTLKPPKRPNSLMVWIDQKSNFFYYLIRIEHNKCSEMCVWIVKFGLKLIKWDHF
jgi:hypothetical protein